MPNRINPIAQYLIWLAISVSSYLVYARFVVPKIEADAHITERTSPVRISSGNRVDRKQQFAHLFPTDAWELAPCKVLKTSQGTVLFQDYQPYDDGRVEVFPFTMVIRDDSVEKNSPDNPDEKEPVPIVLRSSQKAVLKFERAFKLEGGDPGKIQRGQLNGQVSIYRPASEIGADDDLKVLTSNVHLEKHKIYTLDDVEFEFGGNHGYGRSLDIELSHDTPLEAINTDFSKINGVRSLKLGFLQRLRIHPTPETEKRQSRLLAGQKAPLEVRCQGAFEFDFARQLATFDNNVFVKQLDETGQSLQCDNLALMFDSKVSGDQPLTQPKETQSGSQNLQLRRIVATGQPAILNAAEREARISANYLDYDMSLNRVIARRPEGVEMIIGQQSFTSNELEYRIREDGAIGPLIANGPGSMTRYKDGKGFSAQWTKSLSIQPETQDQKRITLGGQSAITLDRDTTIAGNDMQILLWEIAKPETDVQLAQSKSKSANWKYLPHQLHAEGDVQIESAQMAGTTKNITLRWPNPTAADITRLFTPEIESETDPEITPYRSSKIPLPQIIHEHAPTNNPASQPVRVDAPIDPRIRQVVFTQPAQTVQESKPSNKFVFDGDLVEVDFSGHERSAKIQKLILEGNVTVRELDPENPDDEPVEIKGNQLYIIPQEGAQDEDIYRMNVSGNASIFGKGLNLSGPEIHLDQAANRLWVVGRGSMDIETSEQEQPTDQTNTVNTPEAAPDAPSVKPQNLTITWKGGMIFDGLKMYFEDNVSAVGIQSNEDGQRSQVRSLSEGLSVLLSRPVNFRKLKGGRDQGIGKIEIHEMILVDQIANEKRAFTQAPADSDRAPVRRPVVFVKQDFDPQGQPTAKQKIIVPHASVDVRSGNMRAAGPGTVMNWQMGKMEREGTAIIQVSAPTQPDVTSSEKTFVRVNFDSVLIANQEQGRVRVDGKVRSLYVPVDNFDQQFDPDNPTRPAGAIKMTCDQMEIAQWQPRNQTEKTSEFTARGSSVIVGDDFRATGSRIDFSESKGLLTLEGSPRDTANLTYIEPQTNNQRNLAAGKILYRPEDGWTDIQNVQEASLEQKGSLFGN